jgi:predicted  nucleic acid-binding Zn-ribbon protein
MFRCERCGSRYSAMHAVAIENCPRCQIRDHVSAPLTFKAFQLPTGPEINQPSAVSAAARQVAETSAPRSTA